MKEKKIRKEIIYIYPHASFLRIGILSLSLLTILRTKTVSGI